MRKRLMFGAVAVIAVVSLISLSSSQGQQVESRASRPPLPVKVENFPPVQKVEGAVSVGNLPPVQTVDGKVIVGNLPVDAQGRVRVNQDGAISIENFPETQAVWGSVEVENLPLDGAGNLRVSAEGSRSGPLRFVDNTLEFFFPERFFSEVLATNRICQKEFPDTRTCEVDEILRSIPTPRERDLPELFWVWSADTDIAGRLVRMDPTGAIISITPDVPLPIACCG